MPHEENLEKIVEVAQRVGATRINFISVIGTARTGKSTLYVMIQTKILLHLKDRNGVGKPSVMTVLNSSEK